MKSTFESRRPSVLEPEDLSEMAQIAAEREFLKLKFVLFGFGCLIQFVTENGAGLGKERRVKDAASIREREKERSWQSAEAERLCEEVAESEL